MFSQSNRMCSPCAHFRADYNPIRSCRWRRLLNLASVQQSNWIIVYSIMPLCWSLWLNKGTVARNDTRSVVEPLCQIESLHSCLTPFCPSVCVNECLFWSAPIVALCMQFWCDVSLIQLWLFVCCCCWLPVGFVLQLFVYWAGGLTSLCLPMAWCTTATRLSTDKQ